VISRKRLVQINHSKKEIEIFKKYTPINHKKEEEEGMSIARKIQEKYVYQDKQSQLQRKPVQRQ
jgi:hypothetical protein